MTRIGEDCTIFHDFHVVTINHVLVSGYRDKHVPNCCGIHHGHDTESIHDGFEGADWIDFRHNHVGTHPIGPARETSSTPSVTADYNCPASKQDVCCAHDAIERGLSGAIAVVKHVFRHSFVDCHDGVLENSFCSHSFQTNNTCRCFLGST